MPAAPAFLEPRSVEEVTALLETYGEGAKVIAGGTALSMFLRQRLIAPAALVSLGRVEGLDHVALEGDTLTIGALVTHRTVELSPTVRSVVPLLASTFGKVGNVRIRSVATVGGLLAEADYASDPPPVLLVLDAELDVAGPRGVRSIPATQFFRGFFETALAADEIVTSVRIPLPPPRAYGVYEKFVTRSAEDRPCVGVAVLVELAPDGRTCVDLRVGVGAAAETPQRLPEAEALARDQALTPDIIHAVVERYARSIDTLSDLRGSAWYRTEMIRVWVRRSIERARDGAASSGGQSG